MVSKPKILILRTAGTNCDKETAFAFELAGAVTEFVHVNEFISGIKKMSDYQIMAIPGGFSYGDDIASGKILANELRFELAGAMKNFINSGKLIIGICNGFQVLVKAGLLPAIDGFGKIEATLTLNDSGKFEDRWVHLRVNPQTRKPANPLTRKPICIWTKDLPDTIYLPIAHGEGRFVTKDDATLKKLWRNGQVVLQYIDNPNGSVDDIAGICDPTGMIFGLMPHPERHVSWEQHPRRVSGGDGLQIFRNAIKYAKAHL